MRLYEDATRHFVTERFGPVGKSKNMRLTIFFGRFVPENKNMRLPRLGVFLAVRARYDGGLGADKKNEFHDFVCWLGGGVVRARKQQKHMRTE